MEEKNLALHKQIVWYIWNTKSFVKYHISNCEQPKIIQLVVFHNVFNELSLSVVYFLGSDAFSSFSLACVWRRIWSSKACERQIHGKLWQNVAGGTVNR